MEVKGLQSFHELLNVLRFPELSRSVCTNIQANRSSGKKTNTCNGNTHGSDCWDMGALVHVWMTGEIIM